ncbi:serine hydrolase domain-containing protein [Aneurinibacillus migulanus]|uniref:Beta-lactamase n=1 Tax=Aneurinibacillus migulanus TaxID=47500 RepID=A0A0M0H4C2_ANEMI|nr:serine hydrolase domain-containing protein [Aneurinibacillus migulanus]KON96955.1 beta-lactamase [Aneurinibacillus migulanus]MED0896242.1 serine hydrolase [Aneurinibacillus migulanus]MED1618088.1 serine hydrolase [Aneurinibacillus migulanus]SDJ60556.1 CubicO group peptidase, beta-lactamase class C family [Aneurinibacillus migulanus]GED15612.1 penicillin-binding protein [Aneurinibacillus migulanus]
MSLNRTTVKKRRNKINVILMSVMFFFHIFLGTEASAKPVFNGSKVDQYMEKAMERLGIPGASIGIVKGDKLIYLKGYGVAGPEQAPVTPQTPFVLGSTSKSITALATMQLVDEGKVKLDAPVQTYLPWFRLADEEASAKITVKDLLHQTSGISTYEGRATLVSDDIPIDDFIRRMKSVPLAQPVGSMYQYSNLNYDILGGIIQKASQQPYGDYVREHIFKPLNMRHSTAYVEEAKGYGLATGHQTIFGFVVPTKQLSHTGGVPDGSLISSAEDMSNYLIAQMNGGRFSNRVVLSEASVNQMHKPAVSTGDDTFYGMGWGIKGNIIEHSGATENSSSYLMMDGEYGVVLLFNSIDYMVSYDQIVLGIKEVLHGGEPSVDELPNFKATYLIVDLILLILVALYILSLRSLFKWRNKYKVTRLGSIISITLLLLLNILVPLGILVGIPKFLVPWPVALVFLPGITHFLLIFSLLLLVVGVIKAVNLARFVVRSQKQGNGNHV